MTIDDLHDDDEGFFSRNKGMIIIGVCVLAGGGFAFSQMRKPEKEAAPKKRLEMVMVMPMMPPPPPPPPPPSPPKQEEPPPEEEKEEEMIEQPPEEIAQKPDDKPADEPKDEPVGTAITGGDGTSGLGLGGGTGGGGMIGGGGGRKGSRWGWYAGHVQSAVADALRRNSRTKSAQMTVVARVWADATGRITRAQIKGSSGDSALDQAIADEILTGLQLSEPPPSDMPMPINLRLTARRNN